MCSGLSPVGKLYWSREFLSCGVRYVIFQVRKGKKKSGLKEKKEKLKPLWSSMVRPSHWLTVFFRVCCCLEHGIVVSLPICGGSFSDYMKAKWSVAHHLGLAVVKVVASLHFVTDFLDRSIPIGTMKHSVSLEQKMLQCLACFVAFSKVTPKLMGLVFDHVVDFLCVLINNVFVRIALVLNYWDIQMIRDALQMVTTTTLRNCIGDWLWVCLPSARTKCILK